MPSGAQVLATAGDRVVFIDPARAGEVDKLAKSLGLDPLRMTSMILHKLHQRFQQAAREARQVSFFYAADPRD